MDDPLEATRRIVANQTFLALATSSPDAWPWCAPVFYAVTPDWDFLFISATNSRHGQHIRATGRAGWAIYRGSDSPEITDGVQFGGSADELPNEASTQALANILYDQRFPDPGNRTQHPANLDRFEETGRRIYRLRPQEAHKLDPAGAHGVERMPLDLERLMSRPAR